MTDADPHVPPDPDTRLGAAPDKPLPDAAKRALEEAADRREKVNAAARAASETPESGGPKGLEPTRYGDWERKGMAIDFS